MPKILLDQRETELFKFGKTVIAMEKGISADKIPNGWSHDEWMQKLRESLNVVAGDFGGYGISIIGYDGEVLNAEEFSYSPPHLWKKTDN